VPGGGLLPTNSWLKGEIITDEYEVPIRAGAPPGQYVIETGMYDRYTGERLQVLDANGKPVEGDRILLGQKLQVDRW